jgi:hypothetical protein
MLDPFLRVCTRHGEFSVRDGPLAESSRENVTNGRNAGDALKGNTMAGLFPAMHTDRVAHKTMGLHPVTRDAAQFRDASAVGQPPP